jgi:acyl-CoA dehydrogenase
MNHAFKTPRLRLLLPQIQAFVERELLPLETHFSTRPIAETFALCDAIRQKVKAEGLWGLHLPEEAGGAGLTLCEFGQVSEILARAPFFGQYTFGCQAPDIGNTELLHRFASKEIQAKFLEPLMQGSIRSCFSMTEPEFAGSNPTKMATTAVREGDEYVINGHKWFTTAAEGAAFAVVMAVTNPDAPSHVRASMFVVPTDSDGYEHVRNIPIFGETGAGWFSHAEIRYHQVRVPVSYLIGEEGAGFKLAQERLGTGRIHHCMRWIGISEKIFDLMCRRAATREISDGVMLAEKQTIQNWIAEARANINAARLMVLQTAQNIDEQGAAASRDEISAVKFFVSNIFLQTLDNAIQIHGGLGMTDDTILSHLWRHERGAKIYDGTDETHKQNLALSVLKQYGLDLKKKKHA